MGLSEFTSVTPHVAPDLVSNANPPIAPYAKIRRYRERYSLYPKTLRLQRFPLYHITDHSYSYLLRYLPQNRTIVTCHDINLMTIHEWSRYAFRRPSKLLFRWSLGHIHSAAHIIAVSESTRNDLIRYRLADESQISVIPPGLNPVFRSRPDSIRTQERKALGLPTAPLLILHVGQDNIYKNIRSVVKVVAHLRTTGVDAHFVRAGKGLSSGTLALIQSLLPAEAVHDFGNVSDATLSKLYISTDCLLFPSLKEGFGWPVLETMASGTTVITSNDPALAALNRSESFRADANDIAGLSDAVMRAWHDSTVRREQIAINLEYSSRFGRSETSRLVAGVYARVMQGARMY